MELPSLTRRAANEVLTRSREAANEAGFDEEKSRWSVNERAGRLVRRSSSCGTLTQLQIDTALSLCRVCVTV